MKGKKVLAKHRAKIQASIKDAKPTGLVGKFGIGFLSLETKGKIVWFVCALADKKTKVLNVLELDAKTPAEDHLGVDVAIAADMKTWKKAAKADDAVFFEQVASLQYSIYGRFAFYVTHLALIVELMRKVALKIP